jgi:hypothetical protein
VVDLGAREVGLTRLVVEEVGLEITNVVEGGRATIQRLGYAVTGAKLIFITISIQQYQKSIDVCENTFSMIETWKKNNRIFRMSRNKKHSK